MLLPRRRLLLAPLAAAVLAVVPLAAPVAGEAGPAVQVKTVDAALLDAMKRAKELGFEGRYKLLEPVLSQAFDFAYMAEISVGRYWKKLDDAQKQALVKAFSEMSLATYAARFDGYSGEKFEVGDMRDGPRGTKLVSNRLIKSDGEAVPLNYLLRQEDNGGWRIIDVLLEAKYSELATKRSEYTSVIDNQGFDKLLQLLGDKAAELRAKG